MASSCRAENTLQVAGLRTGHDKHSPCGHTSRYPSGERLSDCGVGHRAPGAAAAGVDAGIGTDSPRLDERRACLQKELAQYQRNLAQLLLQKAKYGIRVPLDLVNEFRDTEAEIERTGAALAALESA